jgi:thiamine pyrophosphate-dependent acetolactate synthase large subunit-like protein
MTISKRVFAEIRRQNPQITHISGTNGHYQVVFNNKIYTYGARSLSELCRMLGVKAIRKYEIDYIQNILKRAIQSHGKRNIFCRNGAVIDNSAEIERYTEMLKTYKSSYIIFD